MNSQSSDRNTILDALRTHKPSWQNEYSSVIDTSNYFVQPSEPINEWFKKTLEALSGTCVFCKTFDDVIQYITNKIDNVQVYCTDSVLLEKLENHTISCSNNDEASRISKYSITQCEALVARTASVLVSSAQITGRRPIASAEVHIIIAYSTQLFPDFPQAFSFLESKYGDSFPSQITSITGPSRTADIEKTLVLGAHGPKELIVLLLETTPV